MKWLVSTSKPTTDARRAELDHAPVVAGDALAAALPAVHPLAALGELAVDEDAAARLEQVLALGEEVVAGAQDAGRRGSPPRDRQAGEARPRRLSRSRVPRRDRAGRARWAPPDGRRRRRRSRPRRIVRCTRPRSVAPDVRRHLVPVAQRRGVDGERGVRIPDHQVGVAARRRCGPCGLEARRAAPAPRHPARQLHEAGAAPRAPRSRRTGSAELQRRDAAPGGDEVAALELLQRRRARAVVA